MNDLFKKPDLAALSDRDLLESIYTMLSHRPQAKAPHKSTCGAGKTRHVYPPEFEELWKAFPDRNGSNPKWQAQQCWNARIKQSDNKAIEIKLMLEGTKRYAKWCEATGKTGTETVMQATRFVGTGKEYCNSWICPAPETKVVKLPRDNDELVTFAAGMTPSITPHIGENWWDFRRRVEDSI